MTTTPTIWKSQFFNSTSGEINEPRVVGLANGNFLIAWTEGSGPDTDILGQLYNAEGTPIGTAYSLNEFRFSDNESQPSIAATPDGGFVVSYYDPNDLTATSPGIAWERYDASGANVAGGDVVVGGNQVGAPVITAFADGSFLVTYTRDNGGSHDLYGVLVGADNSVGAETAISTASNNDTQPDVAALSNGNYVVAYAEDDHIGFRIRTTGGAQVASAAISSPPGDNEPHVTALTAGFAISWTDGSGGVAVGVYNNSGGVVAAPVFVTTGNQNETDVVALKDGGFFMVWDDDVGNTIQGQRFSAAGAKVGSQVTIDVGSSYQPEASLTSDGRILVTWYDAGNNVASVILDPRDSTINGTAAGEVITSRLEGALVNGLDGADTLLGQAGADTLVGGNGIDSVSGGGGDDVVIINSGDGIDNVDGGAGLDLLDLGGSSFGAQIDLTSGDWYGFTLTGIENVVGTQSNDFIVGSTAANVLNGAGGDDSIDGGNGFDKLTGFGGLDTLLGGQGRDNLKGGADNDLLQGGAGVDALLGGIGADVIYAATSADVDGSLDGDALKGGNGNDTLYGSGGLDTLVGGSGKDSLSGGSGNDRLSGGADVDRLEGGAGVDTLSGGSEKDTFVFRSVGDSTNGTPDLITDLGNFDRVDLSAIDANSSASGDQKFHLVSAFTHDKAQLVVHYNTSGAYTGFTTIQGDVDGDGVADFTIEVNGDKHNFHNFVY